jgi:ferredoxin
MTSQFATYVITEPCVGVKDATCLEVCPVDCIASTDDDNQYFIDPEVCIACEQCKLVCPMEAIWLDIEVPKHFQAYINRNADFYRKTKGVPMPVPIEKALKMIDAGHAKALELDISISVAVVDEGGRLIAFGRMDRARPMSVDIAINKAYTAATFQQQTTQLAAVSEQSWFQSLIVSTQGKVIAVGGGIPVLDAPDIIGAAGVSGGTPDQDQDCARAAVAAYAD